MVGTAKRKTGELTGDKRFQVEGIAQQVKGKLENVLGQAKDAVREANEEPGYNTTHMCRSNAARAYSYLSLRLNLTGRELGPRALAILSRFVL